MLTYMMHRVFTKNNHFGYMRYPTQLLNLKSSPSLILLKILQMAEDRAGNPSLTHPHPPPPCIHLPVCGWDASLSQNYPQHEVC